MSRHQARPTPRVAIRALGLCCATLTAAAFASAVHPAPEPLPRSDATPTTAEDRVWSAVDASPPVGGPLEIPTIGAVLTDYDQQIEALTALRAVVAVEPAPPPLRPVASEPAPPPPAPALPAPPPPAPAEQPVGDPPAVEPTGPPPSAAEPPVLAPQPTDEQPQGVPPPAPPTPTTEPPADAPRTDAPPSDAPPTDAPPTEQPPPAPELPQDEDLAVGERYELLDADGTVLVAITLVGVDTDPTCTGPGSLPAENGHLIGLRVQVVQGAAAADEEPAAGGAAAAGTEPPPFDVGDFRFVDADDVPLADVVTGSSTACLPDAIAWPAGPPGPERSVEGTVVLDVPAVTGTIVYRPAAWSSGPRWQL